MTEDRKAYAHNRDRVTGSNGDALNSSDSAGISGDELLRSDGERIGDSGDPLRSSGDALNSGGEYMIEVRALTKRFENITALDKMALHVPKGCVYGLVGQNGAGKTTLIRHIAGAYRPDAGEVLIDGERAWENPHAKSRCVHISDDLFFVPSATMPDLASYYNGVYPRFNMDKFEKLKDVFSFDMKRRVSRFSKGMQKQAALWLALCCMPDVMLLDEPVDGLDPLVRRTVWSLILDDVAERQTTVLISSHNLRELDGVSDHIGIMRSGKLALEKSLADLQGSVTKLQIVFAPNTERGGAFSLPAGHEILHAGRSGHLAEYIVSGCAEEVLSAINTLNPQPLFAEAVPLTLEEIFIYEPGGTGHDEILN